MVSGIDFVRNMHVSRFGSDPEAPGARRGPRGPKINRQIRGRIYLFTFLRSAQQGPCYDPGCSRNKGATERLRSLHQPLNEARLVLRQPVLSRACGRSPGRDTEGLRERSFAKCVVDVWGPARGGLRSNGRKKRDEAASAKIAVL